MWRNLTRRHISWTASFLAYHYTCYKCEVGHTGFHARRVCEYACMSLGIVQNTAGCQSDAIKQIATIEGKYVLASL